MGLPTDAELARAIARLHGNIAATRARLAAQDQRLARLRADLARINDGYAEAAARALKRRSRPPAPAVRERRRATPETHFALASSFVAVTLLAAFLRKGVPVRAQAAAPLKDAVASPRPAAVAVAVAVAVAAPAMTPPSGDNAVAEGLRLIYAYRPTAARVTVGEILGPLLGQELRPSSWELAPIDASSFWVSFKPYGDEAGPAREYRFRVDSAAGRVAPTPETQKLLRIDAAGRLASRSDLAGFRQALDLSRDNEGAQR